MSILRCENFNISIDYGQNPKNTTIYTYERLLIQPEQTLLIKLPYFRNNFDKYYKFEINKILARQGLICLYNNLNEESSASCLEFLIKNLNNNETYNALTAIIGSGRKVDVLSGFKFGVIYEG